MDGATATASRRTPPCTAGLVGVAMRAKIADLERSVADEDDVSSLMPSRCIVPVPWMVDPLPALRRSWRIKARASSSEKGRVIEAAADAEAEEEAHAHCPHVSATSFGDGITTKVLIYNATGTTLNLATHHDWHGQIYGPQYPSVIHNGQWGAFIHVRPSVFAGSAGAVVYRSSRPYNNAQQCHWLFSWSIPLVGGSNRVYTAIREEGYFPQHWEEIYHTYLENSRLNHTANNYGYLSTTEIGEDTTANARAIFKLT